MKFYRLILAAILLVAMSCTKEDNSKEALQYLENGKLGMTVDLSIKDMCYNTAMVVSSIRAVYSNKVK